MPCEYPFRSSSFIAPQRGFSLVELVIGIVIMAISFTIISTLILPTAKKSAEQVHQIRAAELGQSMLNEILGKAFDENSDMAGGLLRCGETSLGASNCTADNMLGAEEGSNRAFYDDVDDYNNLTIIESSSGEGLSDIYRGFEISVRVCNDANYDGVCSTDNSNTNTAKLIQVSVTTAQGHVVDFATYKANF